ncbi:MAG: hypothetical protein NTNFB02_34330 [Nitrospira sp.]
MLNKHKHKEFLKSLGVSDVQLQKVPEGADFTDARPDLTEGIMRELRKTYDHKQPIGTIRGKDLIFKKEEIKATRVSMHNLTMRLKTAEHEVTKAIVAEQGGQP